MESNFWNNRWQTGDTGWHQTEVEPLLIQHFPKLKPTTVFVPFTGMSLDPSWLLAQGHSVVGVELVELACDSFFKTNKMTIESKSQDGDFTVYRSGKMTLLCGDFFKLKPEHLSGVTAIYDRAALIALPPDMRTKYAKHLLTLLKPHSEMLLIVIDYPQEGIAGPPFSVSEQDVQSYYSGTCKITRVSHEHVEMPNPKFKGAAVFENAYRITKNL